jgi:hypothetical protein
LRFGGVAGGSSSREAVFSSRLRSVEAKLRAEGLSGGVDSPVEGRMMVFLHRSHMPDVYWMCCLHVLQMVVVEAGAGAVRYLKSKLDRDVEAEQRKLLMSEAELRRGCAFFAFLSLFFAFSSAILS